MASNATTSSASVSISDKYPRLTDELAKYPYPTTLTKPMTYGTAGFRMNADVLQSTFYRMGILSVLLSKKQGKIIGLMTTASHNPAPDNGIKIVDVDGGMLTSSAWETYATEVVNAPDVESTIAVLDKVIATEAIDMDKTGNLFLAKDTRQSSEHLAELAREGALVIGGNVLDFGLQTTPQLHHFVRMWNFEKYNKGDWASESGYYNMMIDAFKQLLATSLTEIRSIEEPLFVDAAHGVGAIQFAKLAKEMTDVLTITVRNLPSDGALNHECGAEHVQKGRKFPSGFSRDADRLKRCCSVDGDADRLIYHYFDENGQWSLLDGDKIASLFATFFRENMLLLKEADLSFGIVQTAYANGASTAYLKSLGVEIGIAKTGVKFCHEKAVEYDIGMYFEANGHGTVLFKDSAIEKLQQLEGKLSDESKKQALSRVLAAHQLINQCVGDAISDALFVEALLALKGWSVQDWAKIYTDLPSRQTKLPVKDRTVIKCTPDETKVTAPEGLQSEIDDLVAQVENGRAFVRPSGTEDVVRVYAEAQTEAQADKLALLVAQVVHRLAGGVGEEPSTLVA